VTDTQSNNHPRATDQSTSTSAQGIKREPVVKTEAAPSPANPSVDEAEASIPTETLIDGPNLNCRFTWRRKVAKRTFPWDLPAGELNLRSPPPQAEDIPVTQEPGVEEPLPITTNEAARETAAPDISEGLPSPATPPSTAIVNVLTRRQSRRQTQLSPIETSEPQQDDDADLSGPVLPPSATMNASTRCRSSRRVIPTSSTRAPIPPPSTTTRRRSSRPVIPPPSTATADVSTSRRSRRKTHLPPIETSVAQPDDADDANADDGDLSDPTPTATVDAATVNAPTRRRSSRRVIPTSSTSTTTPTPSTIAADVSTRHRSRSKRERYD
jgi:hypothetical protein